MESYRKHILRSFLLTAETAKESLSRTINPLHCGILTSLKKNERYLPLIVSWADVSILLQTHFIVHESRLKNAASKKRFIFHPVGNAVLISPHTALLFNMPFSIAYRVSSKNIFLFNLGYTDIAGF